ncbi:MAG: hypothetical protein D3919_10630, partial [Candidatus Electrothrix sp. AW5]|nr:hypothetical protein [Candidatus Electrothrix gigas]
MHIVSKYTVALPTKAYIQRLSLQKKVRIHIGELQHDIKVNLEKIQEKNKAERNILDQLDQI